MDSNVNLIKGFFKRAGSYVFASIFIARFASFLTHIVVLQFIPSTELGVVIYTLSFIAFLLPMAGLGIQQSLVRFGALLPTPEEKEALLLFTLKKGTLITLGLILFIFVVSNFINFEFEEASWYLKILSLTILTQFLLSVVRIYFRLKHQNKKYAMVEITYAILFLIVTGVLSYFYQETGYIIAIIGAPLLVFFMFFGQLKINFKNSTPLHIIDRSFWKYGFFAGLAYVATLLLIEIDNILIGELLGNSDEVTLYKYIALIPVSLLFLPRVLITTDFVYITERVKDRSYIANYIRSYCSIFLGISLFLLGIAYFFAPYILSLFGSEYVNYTSTFLILMVGVSGILILRGLFGNLLSAIGKANLNFVIAVIALGINVVANHYFIPKYGILGASITSAIIMWFTGWMTLILFYINYKRFDKSDN